MVGRARQRGSLTVIVVILIVVVAMLATTITFLFVEDERATVDYLEASSALFVAESGVEKGIRALSLNATYAGEGPTSFGAGTFTITISNTDVFGAALPSSDRRVTSKGVVQGTARTLEVTVRLGGILFQDPFPNITQWGVAVSNTIATCPVGNIGLFSTGGTVSYDVDNATGSTGGSFEVEMIPRNKRRTGSQRVTLASTIAAGSPGLFRSENSELKVAAKDLPRPALANSEYVKNWVKKFSPQSQQALQQAGSPQEWAAFFLASPEMMRR